MQYSEPLTITGLERATNSKDGNPRWRVTLSDGTSCLTEADAAIGGVIDNPEYQHGEVVVAFKGRGAVRTIRHIATVWTPDDAQDLRYLGKYMEGQEQMRQWRILCAKRDASRRLLDD